jgi:asparagine N-glycosylation enzyme membrane subunit Stt3
MSGQEDRKMIWADRFAIGLYLMALIPIAFSIWFLGGGQKEFYDLAYLVGLFGALPIWALFRILDWMFTGKIRINEPH